MDHVETEPCSTPSACSAGARSASRATTSASRRGASSPRRCRASRSTTSTRRRTSRASTPRATSGCPGEYPYTRGPHASMYRGRPWTIRQVAGFGQAEDTNGRFKYLLAHGETGLSTDFDLPTLLGYDSDHEVYRREIGKIGVAVDTVVDMHALFDGIPLDEVSTSLTINAPAAVLLAMYRVVADERGIAGIAAHGDDAERHPQGVHGPERVHLPAGAVGRARRRHDGVRRRGDAALQPAERLRLPHPRRGLDRGAGGGVHDRRRRSATSRHARDRGIDPDRLAPRVSFFWNVHNDFLEEVSKLRAARRLWARMMRERLRCSDPRSWLMRAHCQTSGVSLTAQQPINNVARTAIQALAAVFGGTQSLHTNSLDEAFAIPSEARDQDRRPDPADHPPRERRRRRRRPARRLLLRRVADEPDRGGGRRADRPDRRHGRDDRRDRVGLRQPADRGLGVGAAARLRERRAHDRRRQRLRRRRPLDRRHRALPERPGRGGAADGSGWRTSSARARSAGSRRRCASSRPSPATCTTTACR